MRTRVGFVGAGSVAERHARTLAGFSDVRIIGVTDPAAERAATLAARSGARALADADALLAAGVDAVYVCVPPFAHGPIEERLIAAGVPLFVEKPLARDLETAERLAAAIAQRGLVTATGYHWRYLEGVERAAALLAAVPASLARAGWLDKVPPPAWWPRRELSGGQTIEQTTHVLDYARLLVGEVDIVYAVGARSERPAFPHADVNDVSVATLHFASGALGTVSSTCLLSGPHRVGLHLFCEGMALELSRFELVVENG